LLAASLLAAAIVTTAMTPATLSLATTIVATITAAGRAAGSAATRSGRRSRWRRGGLTRQPGRRYQQERSIHQDSSIWVWTRAQRPSCSNRSRDAATRPTQLRLCSPCTQKTHLQERPEGIGLPYSVPLSRHHTHPSFSSFLRDPSPTMASALPNMPPEAVARVAVRQ
jgi:hypothetical protein